VTPLAGYETARHEFFASISSFGCEAGADGVQLLTAPSSRTANVFDLAGVPTSSVA